MRPYARPLIPTPRERRPPRRAVPPVFNGSVFHPDRRPSRRDGRGPPLSSLLMIATLAALTSPGCLLAQTTQPADYGSPRALAEIQDERIREASGLVASRRNLGCYYVHNDSGDRPRVFLIDRAGRTRATIALAGADALDYEDIALAPASQGGGFEVCVADIGDNNEQRSHVTIYRFAEGDWSGAAGATVTVPIRAYRVRYADGPANAEAFCVHPRTGDGYILTKRTDGTSRVYKLAAPWNAKELVELPRVATLVLPEGWPPGRVITAADIASDGRRLALRAYRDGFEYRLPSQTPDAQFDSIFRVEPLRLSLAAEPQGEALAYSADGQALLTLSEGKSPTLYESLLAAPATRDATGR